MSSRDCRRSPCVRFLSLISIEMITPVIIQPMLVLFINITIPDNIPLISLVVAIALVISVYLAKHDLRSHLLYYWIVLSITYTIIVFEVIVVPLSVIESRENFFVVLFTVLSIFFLYLTVSSNNKSIDNSSLEEYKNGGSLTNGNGHASLCPACQVKMHPRNYHCHICQECIPKYDHHCYWLNCCIGEVNLHFYMSGIFFGIFALIYASMLILTTICSPEFIFGILVPDDCSDAGYNIEMCTCLVCGIYLLELAVVLLFKITYHSWLIGKGISSFEWKEQFRYKICHSSPYSLGFRRNWNSFFRKFTKPRLW